MYPLLLACITIWLLHFGQVQTNEIIQLEDRIDRLRHPQASHLASVPIGKTAPSFQLPTLGGMNFVFDRPQSRLSIIVFFSPNDCPLCLIEALIWRELDELYESKDVSVIGIIDGKIDVRQIRMFLKSRRIEFPVLVDNGALIRQAFGVKHTPIRIIVDSSGRIVDAELSTNSPIKHRNLKEKVARLLMIN